MSDPIRLILASGSPRRRELLRDMGVEFEVHITDIDESLREGEAAQDYVSRLAREKAGSAVSDFDDNCAVLAADTIVVKNDRILGKPRDFEHAQQIWNSLSSSSHQTMTAVCLRVAEKSSVRLVTTDVKFGNISAEQMEKYWQTGEPQDKAGAYAIQGFASAWVKLINGSYSNVVGLPLREVNELLMSIEHNWL